MPPTFQVCRRLNIWEPFLVFCSFSAVDRQAQVGDYKDEIDRLTRELQEVKRRYFEQKRREQIRSEAQRGESGRPAIMPNPQPQMARFTGGGFNLSV